MARRDVKSSRFNSLQEVVPEVVAVVSSKNDTEQRANSQKYFKHNYIDTLKQIIPPFYFSDEQALSGLHLPFTTQLVNSHLIANKNQGTLLPVSALQSDTYLSSINTPSLKIKLLLRSPLMISKEASFFLWVEATPNSPPAQSL